MNTGNKLGVSQPVIHDLVAAALRTITLDCFDASGGHKSGAARCDTKNSIVGFIRSCSYITRGATVQLLLKGHQLFILMPRVPFSLRCLQQEKLFQRLFFLRVSRIAKSILSSTSMFAGRQQKITLK